VLSTALASCEKDEDATLADLARRFRNRVLPKTVPLPDQPGDEPLWNEAHARASEAASRRGLDPELYVWLDVADDVPYRDEGPDEGLWVVLRHHAPQRLGDLSFALEKLRNQRIVRARLCFAPELRDDIVAAIEPVLARAS
jgi:hypothetical protein